MIIIIIIITIIIIIIIIIIINDLNWIESYWIELYWLELSHSINTKLWFSLTVIKATAIRQYVFLLPCKCILSR